MLQNMLFGRNFFGQISCSSSNLLLMARSFGVKAMPQQWQTRLSSIILTEIFWKAIFISCTTSGSSFQNLIDLGGGNIKGIWGQRKRRETWKISVKTISKREHSNINNRLWSSQIFKEKQLDIGKENPWTRLQLYAVRWDIDWFISYWASLCLRLNKWLSRTIILEWSCKKEVEGHPAPPRHGGEPTRWSSFIGAEALETKIRRLFALRGWQLFEMGSWLDCCKSAAAPVKARLGSATGVSSSRL